MLPAVVVAYLELVAKTSRIEIKGELSSLGNAVVGFWHTDSCTMNLLLRRLQPRQEAFSVITTQDKRGDCIETVINRYGGKSVRLPDGIKMKRFLYGLKQDCKNNIANLCIALDGPLGPLHQPKKLGFMLASHSDKNVVLIKVHYSARLALRKRWDNYAIPLPFSHICFEAVDLGKINKRDLSEFEVLKQKIAEL